MFLLNSSVGKFHCYRLEGGGSLQTVDEKYWIFSQISSNEWLNNNCEKVFRKPTR